MIKAKGVFVLHIQILQVQNLCWLKSSSRYTHTQRHMHTHAVYLMESTWCLLKVGLPVCACVRACVCMRVRVCVCVLVSPRVQEWLSPLLAAEVQGIEGCQSPPQSVDGGGGGTRHHVITGAISLVPRRENLNFNTTGNFQIAIIAGLDHCAGLCIHCLQCCRLVVDCA